MEFSNRKFLFSNCVYFGNLTRLMKETDSEQPYNGSYKVCSNSGLRARNNVTRTVSDDSIALENLASISLEVCKIVI